MRCTLPRFRAEHFYVHRHSTSNRRCSGGYIYAIGSWSVDLDSDTPRIGCRKLLASTGFTPWVAVGLSALGTIAAMLTAGHRVPLVFTPLLLRPLSSRRVCGRGCAAIRGRVRSPRETQNPQAGIAVSEELGARPLRLIDTLSAVRGPLLQRGFTHSRCEEQTAVLT
jgi:hypothetical protein